MELTILVPVKNEESNLRPLVDSILRQQDRLPDFELLFINDGSEDGTSAELARLADRLPNLRILSLAPQEHGATVGRALRAGLREVRGRQVVIMDGDLTHDPACIHSLLEVLQRADMVVGSRYLSPNGDPSPKTLKSALSRVVNRLSHRFLGMPIRDCTHGYRALRTGIVPSLELRAEGFPIYLEISWRTFLAGYRLAEVPVKNLPRVAHQSKFRIGQAFLQYLGFMLYDLMPTLFQRKQRMPHLRS